MRASRELPASRVSFPRPLLLALPQCEQGSRIWRMQTTALVEEVAVVEPAAMTRIIRLLIIVLAVLLPLSLAAAQSSVVAANAVSSEVTKLTRPPCKTKSVQAEGANSEQVCPGVLGYGLELLDSDGRMSVTVVTPEGMRHPLDFWTTVTPHFSVVGKTAEWRVRREGKRRFPLAVIVPLNVSEDPESTRVTPYLVVIGISEGKACILQKVRRDPQAVAAARQAIDAAGNQSCPSH